MTPNPRKKAQNTSFGDFLLTQPNLFLVPSLSQSAFHSISQTRTTKISKFPRTFRSISSIIQIYRRTFWFCMLGLSSSVFYIFFTLEILGLVAKIDEFSDILENSELNFQIVGSSTSDRNIVKVKWIPGFKDHVAFLREDNTFMIYDFGNNIDEPEVHLDLNNLDWRRDQMDRRLCFEDFSFSMNKDGYDCSIFSVFFLNNWGEIYYNCPLILNGLKVPRKLFDFITKRLEHEQRANSVERELIERIEGFLTSIKNFSDEKDNYYQINTSKIPANVTVNEGIIQGFEFFFNFFFLKMHNS